MKIAVLAVTALFAAAVPFVFAQEESPSPAATASEKSGDPSVSVTTEKTVSPTPKPASSASPTKSSSPSAKSSPSATPASSPSAAAVMPAKKSTPEATIRDIEDKWEAGVKSHDSSVPQTYVADDAREITALSVLDRDNCVTKINAESECGPRFTPQTRPARALLTAQYAHDIQFCYRLGLRVHECFLGVQRRHH